MIEAVNAESISRAADILRSGGLVAFPTETVYGLGADAANDRAVACVYAAKGRPSFNPLIVHVPNVAAAYGLGHFNDHARRLAQELWPGPLTLVVPRAEHSRISQLASSGLPSIAIRVPAHSVAHELLQAFGRPIVAPSANPSGRISPTAARHVAEGLGDKVELILDGGDCPVGLESTIIGCLDETPQLLRPGGVAREAIETILHRPLADPEIAATPSAPGQLASHYAPRAAIRLNAEAPREGEAYLGFGPYRCNGHSLSPTGDLIEAAANLFRLLHEIDRTGVAAIAVAPIPMTGLGEAINDRLARAAAPR